MIVIELLNISCFLLIPKLPSAIIGEPQLTKSQKNQLQISMMSIRRLPHFLVCILVSRWERKDQSLGTKTIKMERLLITVFRSYVLCQGYGQQRCTYLHTSVYHEYVYVIRACTNTSGMYVYTHQCVIVLSYIT